MAGSLRAVITALRAFEAAPERDADRARRSRRDGLRRIRRNSRARHPARRQGARSDRSRPELQALVGLCPPEAFLLGRQHDRR